MGFLVEKRRPRPSSSSTSTPLNTQRIKTLPSITQIIIIIKMAASFSLASTSSTFLSSSSSFSFSINTKSFLLPKPRPTPVSPKPFSLTSQLTTLPILSFTGEPVGETYINLKSAPPSTARAVVHRAIITDLQNKRRGTASTLTRAEVRGGGRKPYPQKKTGRARRGSLTTPLRPGGGVVFGPKPRDWSIKINRKEKQLAISTALSSAVQNMVVVEDFGDKFDNPKTSEFTSAMRRRGVDPKEKSMFLLTGTADNVRLSSRNIGTLKMLNPRTLNLFDILNADKLVLTPSAVDFLNGRYGVDAVEEEDDGESEEDGEFDQAEGEEGQTLVSNRYTQLSEIDYLS